MFLIRRIHDDVLPINKAAISEVTKIFLRELGLPTLVIQEGGYRTRTLGIHARRFFAGMAGFVHGS